MTEQLPISVLFVCMGNICRSPTAHGVFEELVKNNSLVDKIHVDSAGTIGYHAGSAPDPRTMQTAKQRGVDISHQRSRQVTGTDFFTFDHIIAMDGDNYRNLLAMADSEHHPKVRLLLDFHPDESMVEVPDPYYGGPRGFDVVYDMVEVACKHFLSHLRTMHRI